MALDGGFYDVVGVGLRGPAPVGRAYLALDPGVVALYGMNGAGKSRLLDAIEAALTGRSLGPANLGDLWLRVREPSRKLTEENRRHCLVVALAEGAAEPVRSSWADGAEFDEFEERDRLAAVGANRFIDENPSIQRIAKRALTDFLDLEAGGGSDEFADATEDLASQGHLHLRAVGQGTGLWDLRIAGDLGWMTDGLFTEGFLEDSERFYEVMTGTKPLESYSPGWWVYLEGANVMTHSLSADRWAIDNGRVTRLNVERPAWAAVEISPPGPVTEPVVDVVRLGDRTGDVDAETLAAAIAACPKPVVAVEDETLRPAAKASASKTFLIDDTLAGYLRQLSDEATAHYASFLAGAARLQVDLKHPNSWLTGRGLQWKALDPWTGDALPLDALSAAQRKWAHVAIRLALLGTRTKPTVLLIDEPEASLHRAAEHHLIDGLVRLAAREQIAVIIATHSPVIIGHPSVTKLHVARHADGHAVVQALDTHLADDHTGIEAVSNALGIGPGDLLQMVRCFLLVEGEHDYVVLDELFGPELNQELVRIAALRGAKGLGSAVNAQLIFDFTDAPVCLVLDNLHAEHVDPIWERATRAKSPARAEQILAELDHLEGKEAVWLRDLGTRAARTGTLDRITLATLSQPDIIYYFPPEAFGLKGMRWEELWDAYRDDPNPKKPAFKAWLRQTHRANTSPAKIRAAVRQLDHIPDELLRVHTRALELAGLGWRRSPRVDE